ncbi:MAG: hypothetical protein NUV69_01245 [Candidatus Curtissbacteria bacterium]|nr:hypothetical protein [Candidatus Curtissbacteria bacterium]
MNYIEAPRGASKANLEQYANGIGQMEQLARSLQSQELLPERFAPEPSRLRTSLEGRVRQETLTIGGKTSQELLGALTQGGFRIGSYARSMMESPAFTTLPEPQEIDLVRLQVKDLGISKNIPTTDEIYAKAQELGLDLCPAEVGPQLRLKYKDQPRGEWVTIGMKQIPASDGYPNVFEVGRHGRGLWLPSRWTRPDLWWNPGDQFVFSLRK